MAPKDTVLGKVRLIFQVPMSMTSPFLSLFLGTAFITWLLIPFLSSSSPLWGSKVSKFVITTETRTCNTALTLRRVIKHVEECVKQFLHTSLDVSRGKESQLKKLTRPSWETVNELRYFKDTSKSWEDRHIPNWYAGKNCRDSMSIFLLLCEMFQSLIFQATNLIFHSNQSTQFSHVTSISSRGATCLTKRKWEKKRGGGKKRNSKK